MYMDCADESYSVFIQPDFIHAVQMINLKLMGSLGGSTNCNSILETNV